MVDKQAWSICTMKYGLADKRKAILTQATSWIGLEDVMPGDISQIQKGSDTCSRPRGEVP